MYSGCIVSLWTHTAPVEDIRGGFPENRNHKYTITVSVQLTAKLSQYRTSFGTLLIFTARKRSCGKVMFLHLSVILFTGGCIPGCNGGLCTPPRQTPPPRKTPSPQIPDGHWNGRYASYWNAFLCYEIVLSSISIKLRSKFLVKSGSATTNSDG